MTRLTGILYFIRNTFEIVCLLFGIFFSLYAPYWFFGIGVTHLQTIVIVTLIFWLGIWHDIGTAQFHFSFWGKKGHSPYCPPHRIVATFVSHMGFTSWLQAYFPFKLILVLSYALSCNWKPVLPYHLWTKFVVKWSTVMHVHVSGCLTGFYFEGGEKCNRGLCPQMLKDDALLDNILLPFLYNS